MRPFAFALALTAATAATAGAQAPAAPAAAAPAAAPATAPDLPTPPADFSYAKAGRRDPFVSLTRTGTQIDPAKAPISGVGPQSIAVDEMSVKGIVLANGAYVAIVSGPGGKTQTYTVKVGTKLHDGTVQSITADAVEVLQQVSDPLSLEKQRRVRKPLRTQEEGK